MEAGIRLEGSETVKRHDWTIIALAIGIVALLAFGCVRNTGKERVWRNGEWQDKVQSR